MSTPRPTLSLLLVASLFAACAVEGDANLGGNDKADELGNSDEAEVLVDIVRRPQTLLYFCPPSLEDPRCDNPNSDSIDRAPWPIALDVTMPVFIERDQDVELRTVRTPDLRILLDRGQRADLSLTGSILTLLSTYGMNLDYRLAETDDWTAAAPFEPGFWLDLAIDPASDATLVGNGYACKDCPMLAVERKMRDMVDAPGIVELRVTVLPIFNFGDFDDGDYKATLNIQ